MPFQAVQCRICEVSCRSTEDGSWSNACIEQMKKYSDQTFGFKVKQLLLVACFFSESDFFPV